MQTEKSKEKKKQNTYFVSMMGFTSRSKSPRRVKEKRNVKSNILKRKKEKRIEMESN